MTMLPAKIHTIQMVRQRGVHGIDLATTMVKIPEISRKEAQNAYAGNPGDGRPPIIWKAYEGSLWRPLLATRIPVVSRYHRPPELEFTYPAGALAGAIISQLPLRPSMREAAEWHIVEATSHYDWHREPVLSNRGEIAPLLDAEIARCASNFLAIDGEIHCRSVGPLFQAAPTGHRLVCWSTETAVWSNDLGEERNPSWRPVFAEADGEPARRFAAQSGWDAHSDAGIVPLDAASDFPLEEAARFCTERIYARGLMEVFTHQRLTSAPGERVRAGHALRRFFADLEGLDPIESKYGLRRRNAVFDDVAEYDRDFLTHLINRALDAMEQHPFSDQHDYRLRPLSPIAAAYAIYREIAPKPEDGLEGLGMGV